MGYAVKSASKPFETPESLLSDVDIALKREADKIALRLSTPGGEVRESRGFSVDGFQVVDADTSRVLEQGPWLPTFLPEGVPFPASGLTLYIYENSLYAAQTNTNGRLLATSFVDIGNLWWIAGSCVAGFFCVFFIARVLSRRFLRNYFAVTGIRVPNLEESLRSGEGQSVEFKRGKVRVFGGDAAGPPTIAAAAIAHFVGRQFVLAAAAIVRCDARHNYHGVVEGCAEEGRRQRVTKIIIGVAVSSMYHD